MPHRSTLTSLALLLCGTLGGLPLLAQGHPQMAPLNPVFVRWQKQLEEQQATSNGTTLLPTSRDGHRMGYVPSPLDLSHVHSRGLLAKGMDTTTIPATYDLRTKGYLTPVRNQGYYGTCWAHAALASLESTQLAAGRGTFSLSPWHLAYYRAVDFDSTLVAFTQKTLPAGEDAIFDQGGNAWGATALLGRGTGAVNEADCPYHQHYYTSADLPKGTEPVSVNLRNTYYLGEGFSAADTKASVMAYGAVAISIYADDNFQDIDATHTAYRYTPTGSTNHGVNIVGWDDNYPASNFPSGNQPSTNGAWIVRNSWGSSWGDSGYFYMSYDSYIGTEAVFLSDTKTYSRIYQYDPLGWVSSWGDGNSPTFWGANVFTAKATENLGAVSFYAGANNTTYEIDIRTGVTGDPTTGTLALGPVTGTLDACGYHTIALPTTVPIAKDQKFAVIVKFNTPGDPGSIYPVPIEYPIAKYSEKATSNVGESYASPDGITWADFKTNPDAEGLPISVCIKAFATAGTPPASAPVVSSFTPASGPVGTAVTISGTGFTGASAVKFNGTSATFNVTSDTAIAATVPAGATTGTIAVTTAAGTGTSSSNFTVTAAPVVSISLSPKPASILAGGTQAFTAAVTGSSNTGVNWTATGGTLSATTGSTVTFTAQATAGTATVTATAAADATKHDAASFSVLTRDVSGDGTIDVADFAVFAKAYGSRLGDTNYAPAADLNGDGVIDDSDITIFFAGF